MKIKITWNGTGGEINSVVVTVRTDYSVAAALKEVIGSNIVSADDTFTIKEIE